MDRIEAALYGRYAVGADYLAASLGYGRHAVDSRRTIAIGSQRWQAEGDYHIDSLSLDLEAGHAFVPQAGTQLTPFVGLGYARHDREDFTERGAGAAALRLDDEDLESIHSRLGLRLNQALAPLAGRPLSLEAEAAWMHEFGDHTASLGARFDQAPAAPFRVDGPETDSDRLQASLGLTAELSRANRLFIGYQGEYAGSNREHALSATWQTRW